MDLSKFTERSRGFIQAAQTIATRESHQRLSPEHVLKALLDDDQGLARNLIAASGGDGARVMQALDLALGKYPYMQDPSRPPTPPRPPTPSRLACARARSPSARRATPPAARRRRAPTR